MQGDSKAAWAPPSLLAPPPHKEARPHACSCYCSLLQHLGVEAEVEAHALSPALFVAGGNGAEPAVPGLPAPVPALNLGGQAQEAGLRAAATPPVPTLPAPWGSTEAALTCSPVSGLITVFWSKLNAPFSSCRKGSLTWGW